MSLKCKHNYAEHITAAGTETSDLYILLTCTKCLKSTRKKIKKSTLDMLISLDLLSEDLGK